MQTTQDTQNISVIFEVRPLKVVMATLQNLSKFINDELAKFGTGRLSQFEQGRKSAFETLDKLIHTTYFNLEDLEEFVCADLAGLNADSDLIAFFKGYKSVLEVTMVYFKQSYIISK